MVMERILSMTMIKEYRDSSPVPYEDSCQEWGAIFQDVERKEGGKVAEVCTGKIVESVCAKRRAPSATTGTGIEHSMNPLTTNVGPGRAAAR